MARFYPKVDLIPGPVPYSRLQVPPPYNCRVLVLGPRPPGKSTSPSALTLSPHALGSSPPPSAQVPPTPFPLARPSPPPRYSHPTPFHLRYHTPLPTASRLREDGTLSVSFHEPLSSFSLPTHFLGQLSGLTSNCFPLTVALLTHLDELSTSTCNREVCISIQPE